MYERVILWATPAFFVLMLLEAAVAWRRGRRRYRLADAVNSVGIGALSTYVGVLARGLGAAAYLLVYQRARLGTLDGADPWVWLGGIVLYDFLYYWYHRLGHEVALLWAAHVVHHQSEEYNLSTALRQTSTGFLLGWVFFLPMALLGFPPALFLALGLVDLLYQFWIHTEQVGSLGLFDRCFASPSNHRVHHAVNDPYLDRNYGGLLMLWDRLFGTFQPELAAVPPVYGTREPLRSWNPLWANLHTYASLARRSARATTLAGRLGVWLRHPGWQPAGIEAARPRPPFSLAGFAKFAPPLPLALGAYCLVQGLVVLGFGTHFLSVAPGLGRAAALAYLGALAASLGVLGGLTEGRRGFVAAEGVRLALAAVAIAVLLPGAAAVALAGAALSGGALWRATRALGTATGAA